MKQKKPYTKPTIKLLEKGDFGTKYIQFECNPIAAIKHLKKQKQGEAVNALYRSDIGYISIIWGENDPKTNKGFGLKHIIEKHGKEIEELGFSVESFISIIVQFGSLKSAKEDNKILLESNMFRVVLLTEWKGKKKHILLTAFDLRKRKYKK